MEGLSQERRLILTGVGIVLLPLASTLCAAAISNHNGSDVAHWTGLVLALILIWTLPIPWWARAVITAVAGPLILLLSFGMLLVLGCHWNSRCL
ncbi:MAG: hypothetical protein ABL962_05500 [Fimbriimonadaceae bacterium]